MADCQDLIDAIASLSTLLDGELTDIKNAITGIDTHMYLTDTILTDTKTEISGIKTNIATTNTKLENIDSRLYYPDVNTNITKQLNLLTGIVNLVATEFDGFKTRFTTITSDIGYIKTSLANLNIKIDTLNTWLNNIEGDLSASAESISDIAGNTNNINLSLIAQNIILGVLGVELPIISTQITLMAAELPLLVAELQAMNIIQGSISADTSTLATEILSIINALNNIKNNLEYYDGVDTSSISELIDLLKQAIEGLSIDVFFSKDNKTIQVKG